MKKTGVILNGLTIPYLIGAQTVLDETITTNDDIIKDFLEEIIASDTEFIAVLQYCNDINQFVIGMEDREYCEIYLPKYLSLSNSNGRVSLHVTANAASLGKNIEEISESLIGKYKDYINTHDFSWKKKNMTWNKFSKAQKNLIRSSKN